MNYFLLDGVIRSAQKAGEAVTNSSAPVENASGGGMGALGFLATVPGMILYFIIIIGLFYFFGIRPQKKREKALKNLQDEIKLGDWVLLDSGMYGKVAGISENVFTIEFGTNKGVLIPVLKQRIVSKSEPNFSNEVESK